MAVSMPSLLPQLEQLCQTLGVGRPAGDSAEPTSTLDHPRTSSSQLSNAVAAHGPCTSSKKVTSTGP